MNDLTITCTHCKTNIKLTESLTAPLLAATKQEFEQKQRANDAVHAQREAALKLQEQAARDMQENAKANIATQVSQQLNTERSRITAEAIQKAQTAVTAELANKTRETDELKRDLEANNVKLAEAQTAQTEAIKEKRALESARRELELTITKRVQEDLETVRSQAHREVQEAEKLKIAERDLTIASLLKNIEDLKQKAEQGSQQAQGEVQELELERTLRAKFPYDVIEPVAKGEYGGDTIQRINSIGGMPCGSILWESKRTKTWSDGWLAKLRDDQRAANSDVCVIVSQTLPKGVETFDLIDGVWVTTPRAALPVATMLREGLLQISQSRALAQGQHTKAEMVYQYLTGQRFKLRIGAIVESFETMQEDLERERKLMQKHWAKRSEQIERVMNSTLGMYGDLQGIAGKSLPEIEGLELPQLTTEHSMNSAGGSGNKLDLF